MTPQGGKKRTWQGLMAKILILVFSLLVCMEGGSRLVLSINPFGRFTGIDDSSYRLRWIGLHPVQRGVTSDRQLLQNPGEEGVYHLTRGWTLRPGIRDMSVFEGKILNSNSQGLREKTEYGYQRTPGKQRIIVLGASLTFGSEVSDDETYSHQLEATLPNTEVLNFGVPGYGHDQMLLYLKEEGVKYHPDIVILGFAFTDIYRNLLTFFAYAKPKFKIISGGLELTNVPVPTPEHVLAEEFYRPKALDTLVVLREKLRWTLGKNETEARAVTRLLLDEIITTTHDVGAIPVFVYLPILSEIRQPVAEYERYLSDYCQERRIRCLSLGPRFSEEAKRGVNLQFKGHWNGKGHSLAGEEIRDFLLRNRLIENVSASDPGLIRSLGEVTTGQVVTPTSDSALRTSSR